MKLKPSFVQEIRELILSARAAVARGADLVQVRANFEIGCLIVMQEQKGRDRAAYGKEVIKALAERLVGEFGRGFSERNLAYMRAFYRHYQERPPILQSAIAKSAQIPARSFSLSWTHYVFLLGIGNPEERSFYEIEAVKQGWTVRELKRQFDSSFFERLALRAYPKDLLT